MSGCRVLMKALCVSLHVSHGYVGNRACTFPLQYQGWDVDAVNTTNFSNHPGYGKLGGNIVESEEVEQVLEGLAAIMDVSTEYSMVIIGYFPRAQTVEVLRQFCARLHPLVVLIVDPVMGDNGKLYVQDSIVPAYKQLMVECGVTLTTPNLFEFETLTGCKISSWTDLQTAVETFYDTFHIPNLVILSIEIEGRLYAIGALKAASDEQNNALAVFYYPVEKLNCSFNGSGDVLTALLSHSFFKNGCKLTPEVLSEALFKLEQILRTSIDIEQHKTGKTATHIKDIQVVALRAVLDQEPQPRPVFWL